ncbi:MAG: hypothetical protein WCF67_19200 [Chitinophagaceae bacterium]
MSAKKELDKPGGATTMATQETRSNRIFGMNTAEFLTAIISLITLIGLVVTFIVSFQSTQNKVIELSVKVDSTNATLNRVVREISRQNTIQLLILEDDSALYKRVTDRLRQRELIFIKEGDKNTCK